MAKCERRDVTLPLEVRAQDGDQTSTLDGYAAVFNAETVIAGLFREKILPGAFTDTLRQDDIQVMFNHNPNKILARMSNGTVAISEDATGLRYVATLDLEDPDARSVARKVQRRTVKGSSFSFLVENENDEDWVSDDRAKLPLRIVKRARVFDVGPVSQPAYEQTTAQVRSKAEAFVEADRMAIAEHEHQLQAEQVAVAIRERVAVDLDLLEAF